ILEALKLLLEDDAMAERVQVLALIDEEVISVAIREKFASLIKHRAGDTASTVREHLEKLFLCTLRLQPLRTSEVDDLLSSYVASHGHSASGFTALETASTEQRSTAPRMPSAESPADVGLKRGVDSQVADRGIEHATGPARELFTESER